MNKHAYLFVVCLISFFSVCSFAQERGTVTYVDKAITPITCHSIRAKEAAVGSESVIKSEVSSREGGMIATCEESYFMSGNIKRCLRLAMDAWEARLSITTPIRFYVCISDEEVLGAEISTTVTYYKVGQYEAKPTSLCNQSYRLDDGISDTIKINPNVDWNTTWPNSASTDGTVSLTDRIVCHIGRILGFGTSTVLRSGGVGFAVNRCPSRFDRMLFCGDKSLYSLATASGLQIESFFAGDLLLKGDSFTYDIYDTQTFQQGISGSFFSLGYENLMEANLPKNLSVHTVGREVLNVLKQIGWKVREHDYTVICDKTDSLGFGSAYDKLGFEIQDEVGETVRQASWSYEKYDNESESYVMVSSYEGGKFSVIPQFSQKDLDRFVCHQARVVCNVNNKEYVYPLTLDVRPKIEEVLITNITEDSNVALYNFDFQIRQKGTTSGTILVSDDSGVTRQYAFNNEPIHAGPFVKGLMAYIHVMLENTYGTSSRYIFKTIYPVENIKKESSDALDLAFTVNGMPCKGAVRDGDLVHISLGGTPELGTVESLACYLITKNYQEQEVSVQIPMDENLSFVVHPGLFDPTRFWKYTEEILKDQLRWNPDCCRLYVETKSTTRSNTPVMHRYLSSEFSLDVLPAVPHVEILEAFERVIDGMSLPYAKVKIESDNFTYGFVHINQWPDAPEYVDTTFTCEPNMVYDICMGYPGNRLYCVVINDYGSCSSNVVCPTYTTSVTSPMQNDIKVDVKDRILKLQSQNLVNISLLDSQGRYIDKATNIVIYQQSLLPGFYIVRVEDKENCKISTRKILVK